MQFRKNLIVIVSVLVFVLAACNPAEQNDMMETEAPVAMEDKDIDDMSETATPESMDDNMISDESMMEMPDWFSATFTDATTGRSFSIADFKGKVVLVETLAMWCSNCLRQQKEVKALHDALGERDDFISIGIDIDPNENIEDLKSYVAGNGFTWLYTVAPEAVYREIGNLYGAQFLNPPSTPMLIIDRHGEVHLLGFGIKSADDLLQSLQPFLDEGM